jgi:hypothetical protein
MSGCMFAVLIGLGLFVLIGVGLVVGVTTFLKSDAGKTTMEAVGAAVKGASGPGPEAMKAAGCKQAFVLDLATIASAAQKLTESATTDPAERAKNRAEIDKMAGTVALQCGDATPGLTCAAVFQAYRRAVPPEGHKVFVNVKQGRTEVCDEAYDAQGTLLPGEHLPNSRAAAHPAGDDAKDGPDEDAPSGAKPSGAAPSAPQPTPAPPSAAQPVPAKPAP